MGKILVVDDEPGIIRFVRRALEAEGHSVITAHDGATALTINGEQDPDLVILDLLMPGLSGIGVLAAVLTERPQTRVLVLSAVADVQMRVRCLELGATDYLMKPFAIAELVARVNKRVRGPAHERVVESANVLAFGDLRLDLRARRLECADDSIELSQRESAVMQHLIRRGGDVCTRAELLSEVWGYAFDPGSNVVDVTIARLRGKIRSLRIDTVRNVGYALHQV
jgi:two-component system, OmpR family, response regulator